MPFGVGYVELPGEVKVEARLTESDPDVLRLGMEMELVVLPFRTDDDGNEVVTFAFRPVELRRAHGMDDVAIIGVGLHPFGRFPGVTAIDMGAIAIRRALADAGVAWRDIQFAFAGSYEVDNPDAVVALLGLTGIPFTDVYNGCATAASALTLAANTIRLGDDDLGIAVGMDKHLPGAFTADPRLYACPSWYGEVGHFLTTKFFGMKINKYMHDHGISHRDSREGRGEELPQRWVEPERVPAQAALRGGDPRLPDAELPAHAVHVLRARRGCRRGGALPRRPGAPIHRDADLPPRDAPFAPGGSVRSRCTARGSRSRRRRAPPSMRPEPHTRWRASGPKTST